MSLRRAIYDGCSDVILRLPPPLDSLGTGLRHSNDSNIFAIGAPELEVRISFPTGSRKPVDLQLRLWLDPEYLAADASECTAPRFELSSGSLAHGQLSRLCQQLDRIFIDSGEGPVLYTWIEWLRLETLAFLCLSDHHSENHAEPDNSCQCWDRRAVVIWNPQEEPEQPVFEEQKQETCANCCAVVTGNNVFRPVDCDHALCSQCLATTLQVHSACSTPPRCPMPQCRAQLPNELADSCELPKLWAIVSKRILGTPFQDVVVFCPKCEDRGMDIPVLTTSSCSSEAAVDGVCQCQCFRCSWRFCGVCRSPYHPNESCLGDESRVVRMAKRRPPLPPNLAEVAVKIATDIEKAQRQREQELRRCLDGCGDDFHVFRKTFLNLHEHNILRGLDAVFPPPITLGPAPLSLEVKQRFMKSILAMPSAEVRPAFHGTDAANHASIFKRGVLIPGQSNELRVVHGAAHGTGVYTANVDAAWLSKSFCSDSTMLVCAVIQSNVIRHVGDAMVVGNHDHVIPLFEASAPSFLDAVVRTAPKPAPVVPQLPSVAAKPAATLQLPAEVSSGKGKLRSDAKAKEDKSSKFKARLAKRSQRH